MHKKNAFVRAVLRTVFCSVLLAAACFLTGCASTERRTDGSVIEHQRRIGEYQASVQYYLGRIDAGAERIDGIRERAESLGGEVDGIIGLFDEYQRAVEQLLRDYEALRDAVEKAEKDAGGAYSGFYDPGGPEDMRVLPLLEGNKGSAVAGYSYIGQTDIWEMRHGRCKGKIHRMADSPSEQQETS